MSTAINRLSFRNRRFFRGTGIVCLVLFLALQAFVISESLHRALHADASTPGHTCAVTLLGKGQIETAAILPATVSFNSDLIFILPPRNRVVSYDFDYRLSPSRAPPLT